MVREVLRSRRSSIFFMVGVLVIAGLLAVKVVFFPENPRESASPSASASAAPSLSAVAASAGSVKRAPVEWEVLMVVRCVM